MRKNEKGFSPVVVLLLLVILGLIVGAGWYVWRSKNKSNIPVATAPQADNSTSNGVSQQGDTPVDETAGWKEEKNTEFGYSYRFPNEDGWKTFYIKAEPGTQAYTLGERVNNTGVNYTLCGSNCGLVFSFRIFAKGASADPGNSWGEKLMEGNNYYKLASKQDVIRDGVAGIRWEYQPGDGNAAKIIYYYFAKDNLSYALIVNSNGALTDKVNLTEFGEKIMQTFKFSN